MAFKKITMNRLDQSVIDNMGGGGGEGTVGPPGPAGADGKTWYSGTSNPNGSLGVVGDFHLNRTTWEVREKTGASTWTLRGSIKGEQGIQGIQGPPGLATSTIEPRTSDPINPEIGRIWIRSDL